jgi:hypothetical protein
MNYRLRNPDALLVTFGEIVYQAVANLCEAATLFGPSHGRRDFVARDPSQLGTKSQVFIHAEITIEGGMLRQITNFCLGQPGLFKQINATNVNLANRWGKITGNDLHGCGFTGAIGTEEAQYLTLRQLKADISNGYQVAIVA